MGQGHSPTDGFSLYGGSVDKERKEALQVTKELVAKFIETRNVSPGNFAELFPAIFKVVYSTVRTEGTEGDDEA